MKKTYKFLFGLILVVGLFAGSGQIASAKSVKPYKDPTTMRKGSYWNKSSETKSYPNLRKTKNLNLRVSIRGNRTYVRSGKKVVYTMYSSAGKIENGKSLTPTGTYYTNNYHPHRFDYALYPVGWIGQEYLFHSTPTYLWSNKFNMTEAKKLGKMPASHGCIRLTVKDAKWLHDHVSYRTKVIIYNHQLEDPILGSFLIYVNVFTFQGKFE